MLSHTHLHRNFLIENEQMHSFSDLPEKVPYGFVIYPNGNFKIVDDWGGHQTAAGGPKEMDKIIDSGGLRMARLMVDDGGYGTTGDKNAYTNAAKKTATDLASFYKEKIQFYDINNYKKTMWESLDLVEDYPVAWNKEEFEAINSFAGKARYASEHLTKIASGSGRVVFKIDDQKVLKLAKNKKGLAQNAVEAESYLQNYDIVARTFDKDSHYFRETGPFWVEMELAKKVTRTRFEFVTGVSIEDVDWYLREENDRKRQKSPWRTMMPPELRSKLDNNELIIDLMSLSCDYDMQTGDMGRLSTYGEVVRDGQPKIVLVDFGLTSQVWNDFYKVA